MISKKQKNQDLNQNLKYNKNQNQQNELKLFLKKYQQALLKNNRKTIQPYHLINPKKKIIINRWSKLTKYQIKNLVNLYLKHKCSSNVSI